MDSRHTKIGKHDRESVPSHEHHNAGRPGSYDVAFPRHLAPQRFPSEEYNEYGYSVDDLEVEGFNGFIHVRCPWSSPNACGCGRYSCHVDSIIVAVDGACPGNGTDKAIKSGCGVYFGPSNFYTSRLPDNPNYTHTNQRAELYAVLHALELSEEYAINGGQADCDSSNCAESCRLRHIVIKSDSAYVVNSMTSHVHKWQVNGWMTAKKTPVSNKDVFEALLEKIEEFETQHLTAVDFWLVPRAQNTEADELANQSLSLSAWFDY